MKHTSRIEAQQRADDIRIFRKKSDRLEAEGVLKLADGQRAAVRAHHDGYFLNGMARYLEYPRNLALQLKGIARLA